MISVNNLKVEFGVKPLLSDVSFAISDKEHVALVGKNGAGKSTFLKMLCGLIKPDSGKIVLGDTVNIGYFSQECEEMDPSLRVIEYIRETADIVRTPDGTVTASQMLERFLFNSELQWNRIEKLSGGERKRLYLLKILMQAPNILLLDEPTNDLDITTLTILEDYLRSFSGAVIAVSHDRYFLDKTASEIFEFKDGQCTRFNGNYSDYAEKVSAEQTMSDSKPKKKHEKRERNSTGERKARFSFREQREYDTIDSDIASLEEQIAETEKEIVKNASDYVKLQELSELKESLESKLEEKMERWVYLNELAERIEKERAT